jgi:7-cyano-7-deazaguanine synthase
LGHPIAVDRPINYQITRLPNYQMQTAVLLSGGLDSAVLVADEAASGDVQPIYVSVGLAWESAEASLVPRFLASAPLAAHGGRIRPLVSLSVDMRDVYASTHWAREGRPPSYHTPDEDVYLPGRNVVLLGKAGVYCAAAHIDRLVIGTLAHNPFPDATPEFRAATARALSLGLAHDLRIDAPYSEASKADVIRRGAALGVPFELTLSCMSPPPSAVGHPPSAVHCGLCSKCRERHDAFVDAGLTDPTEYATRVNLRGTKSL